MARKADYCESYWRENKNHVAELSIRRLRRPQWCNACLRTHPAMFFSTIPRRNGVLQNSWGLAAFPILEKVAFSTNCIRSEGFITICEHKKVSYMDLCSWKCYLTATVLPSVTPRPFHPFECASCISKDLYVPHTGLRINSSVQKSRLWSRSGSDAGQASIESKHRTNLEIIKDLSGTPQIIKSWRIPIFSVGDSPGNGRQLVPVTFIRDALRTAECRSRHLLCGHMSFIDGSFFDALYQITQKATNDPEVVDVTYLSQVVISSEASKGWWKRKRTGRSNSYVSEQTLSRVNCDSCGSQQSWQRNNNTFFIEGRHNLSCCRLNPSERTMDMEFISAMDPQSYHLREDVETRHITWCPYEGCSNARNAACHLQELTQLDKISSTRDNPPPYRYVQFISRTL